jgi:hypothetical protein
LVVIETSEENDFLEAEFESIDHDPDDNDQDVEDEWWLGGLQTDSAPRTFSWVDGTDFWIQGSGAGFHNFFSDQPNDQGEECVESKKDGFYGWNDQDCNQQKDFACEAAP